MTAVEATRLSEPVRELIVGELDSLRAMESRPYVSDAREADRLLAGAVRLAFEAFEGIGKAHGSCTWLGCLTGATQAQHRLLLGVQNLFQLLRRGRKLQSGERQDP